jgi:formate/nitrite transporter FocA (FNT family)
VVIGRQQLFTENTLTVILPLLDGKDKLKILCRCCGLWGLVLFANLLGAGLIALAFAHSGAFEPAVRDAMTALGREAAAPGFQRLAHARHLRGLADRADGLALARRSRTLARMIVLLMTYLVAMLGLSHIIAGSVEVLYLVETGALPFLGYLFGFALPVFIGNVIGGVALVALLNYGQVVAE